MIHERFLVTGACGCIGAWVLRLLADEGCKIVASDVSLELHRVEALLPEATLERIDFRRLDILDQKAVDETIEGAQITHIIHLAGLQVPFCKANPSLGAQVNVTGTVHILDAARKFKNQIRGLTYASSVAVLGPPVLYGSEPLPDDVRLHPETLYGVYKVADEMAARVYWNDWQTSSVGIRPYVVYGVGRDQGLTSDLTKAILAACAQRSFRVKFSGNVLIHYVRDVAEAFIRAARANYRGAAACNLGGSVISVGDFLDVIRRCVAGTSLTFEPGRDLPFPCRLDDAGLRSIIGDVPLTDTESAVRETCEFFCRLIDADRVDLGQL